MPHSTDTVTAVARDGALTLASGQTLKLTPTPDTVLFNRADSAVLVMDWRSDTAPAYRVPAHLSGAVARSLNLTSWI